MERLIDESEYVLAVLYRTREQVYANPNMFAPDAQERINEAITRIQEVLRSTRSQLMISRVGLTCPPEISPDEM